MQRASPSLELPEASPPRFSCEEDLQLAKQAKTIHTWSTQEGGYSVALSFLEDSSSSFELEVEDPRLVQLYEASVELTKVGLNTVMAPTVARRFAQAMKDLETPDTFHDFLFTEAMESYKVYGRMEAIVCEMENLIISVLRVLDDRRQDGFDIIAGKAGDSAEAEEEKTKMIMNRVFELLAALSEEAKSFNFMAWLQAMGECDMEVTELAEGFITQKQEVQRLLWIAKIEAGEFLNGRMLVAVLAFLKWFEKMRKAADDFQELLLKQYNEGSYQWYDAKKMFQKQSESRKRWAQKLQEKKEACRLQALDSHGRRLDAAIEMRRAREAEKEEPPQISGLPTQTPRKSKVQALTLAPSMTMTRRSSYASKRSSHMEEQIRNYVSSARQHLEDLQGIEQEYRQRERKAMDLVIRLLMKMRSLERRRMRQTTTNITERVNTVMPGRFVASQASKSWPENEDFSVTSSLLQQQALCRDLNELVVSVELKDIWTGVEGKFLMKAKVKKAKAKAEKAPEKAPERAGALWGLAKKSFAAGNAISAIQAFQAERAEAAAAEVEPEPAEEEVENDDDLFNFPKHFSLVDVQLLLSDAAVERTEKLRELRKSISKVVQHIGAKYGPESWVYNAQSLEAYSNTNPWAVLIPVVEKELMSLGESGRFFLSRQDAASLQDLMRMIRSVKSELAYESSKNRAYLQNDVDRWSFESEPQIRVLMEQLRQMRITLQDRKQKAAKLDIRAEHTQELAQLHPELRSGYGLVQKGKKEEKVEEKKVEQEEEEEEDPRMDSFKTFLFALKFKQRMSDVAHSATKLREMKVQLEGTIANSTKMTAEDFEATRKMEEEKEYLQNQVLYLKRLASRKEMTEMSTFHLNQMRSELAVLRARAEGRGLDAPAPVEDELAAPRPISARKKRRKEESALSSGASEEPRGQKRVGRRAPRGQASPREQSGESWFKRASTALIQEPSAPKKTRKRAAKAKESSESSSSASERPRSGRASGRASPRAGGRRAVKELFSQTMKRRLKTASEKSAATIFKKTLIEAHGVQDLTQKILESKRQDLQNVLKLTLEKFGIMTLHRIQSAREQQARWDGEVAYMADKLRRSEEMATFWHGRHGGWLAEITMMFGSAVFEAFTAPDRRSDRERWSKRLQEALHDALEGMLDDMPSADAEVSHHIDVPETESTRAVTLGDLHMSKLMQRQRADRVKTAPLALSQGDTILASLPEAQRPQRAPTARPLPGGISSAPVRQELRDTPPVAFEPELPEPVAEWKSKQLPSWLKSAKRTNTRELAGAYGEELEGDFDHVLLARRRSVQPWVEPIDMIEDASYRAALKTLQKQFHRGKTQDAELWGLSEPLHAHRRRKPTEHCAKDRVVDRKVTKKMASLELEPISAPRNLWRAAPASSLRRARPKSKARTGRGFDCVLTTDGVQIRTLGRRLLPEPSVAATSGTEATEAAVEPALRSLRRFRRRLLKRYCSPEEAFNAVFSMPVSRFLDYEHFCELCELIHFDLEDAWPVWRKLCGLLGQEKMDCGAFGRGMSYAWPIKDLSSLRIRLQLRYSTLARAFESMERRHLDADAWNELLSSVGASQEEAKSFFDALVSSSRGLSPKISRRTFILVLSNAEGFTAGSSLMTSMSLKNAATAWRALMEYARRTAKHKGMKLDTLYINARDLQFVLEPLASDVQCEALLRMACARRQVEGVRLEEVLLAAVASLGHRADEVRKELGRDFNGEEQLSLGTRQRQRQAAAERLRRSMAISVAEAARKLQNGEAHSGTSTLLGIVGQRPPSRSVASSDSEELSMPSSRKSSPTKA